MKGYRQQRSAHSWTLAVDAGRDEYGRRDRRTRTIKTSKPNDRRAAQRHLERFVIEIEDSMDVRAHGHTWASYFDYWIAEKRSQKLERQTLERYEELDRLHIRPVIGKIKLDRLRPADIQRVYRVARAEGTYPNGSPRAPLSEQTLEHIHRRIFAALRQAVRWQLVARNVAEAVIAPKSGGHERDPFTAEVVAAMVRALEGKQDLLRPALFILATGLRRGELLGLRWADVDLEEASVHVRNTLTKHMEFKPPKTHRSKRPLALSAIAVAILREQRRDQSARRLLCGGAWQNLDLVFDRGDGGPARPDTFTRRIAKAMAKAGLHYSPHDLRHAFGDGSVDAGIETRVTQDSMGHSSITTTAKIYTRVVPRAQREAAQKFDSWLGPIVGDALR